MTTAAELPALLEGVRARLAAAGARQVELAESVPERRVLGFRRRPTLRKAGRGWLLGALILREDGALLDAGTPTRAKREARVGYSAESARERDALRHMAERAGFAEGAAVHVDPRPAEAGPLVAGGAGELLVRWSRSPGIAPVPLSAYLEERAELLGA